MATIKSYTDIEQSRKLAEIMPIESADMFYNEEPDETYPKDIVDTKYPMVIREGQKHYLEEYGIPCWSLAALHGILNENKICHYNDGYYCQYIREGDEFPIYSTAVYNNSIDACYEIILKLHELNLL